MTHFIPNFIAMATVVNQKQIINDTVKLDDPENRQLKITILSYTQPRLCGLTHYLILLTGTIVICHIFEEKLVEMFSSVWFSCSAQLNIC